MSPPPSDPVAIRIRDIAKGGAGVGHAESGDDERTWFVEGALPGELIEAIAFKTKRKFVRAEAGEVREPSPHRVEAPCVYAQACGGCDWQHVDPEAQARLKADIVAGQLRKLDFEMLEPVPSPAVLGYRRRARMHYEQRPGGGLHLGFHRRQSREIEDIERCVVLEPVLDAALQRLRERPELLAPVGEVHALSDGKRVVLGLPRVKPNKARVAGFEAMIGEAEDAGLVGVVMRGNRKRATVGIGELDIDGARGADPLRVGPFAFAQAQMAQNLALVAEVEVRAQPRERTVLELYAGAGNFTRRLARGAHRLDAVDDSREGINALRRLVGKAAWPVHAKAANVDKFLPGLVEAESRYDVVVLDPPRGGVGIEGAQRIAKLARARIVYVSCDPATLARDLAAMLETNPKLRLRGVRVFDMMPMTSECETVAWLEVEGSEGK